ncbi:N,N-dimethylformamidase beta subunit family domain-containing protein [Anderseniella sp. Alg231-50]|uniref:N,N-dimethylformamidase beta subunit family domain-containing protein n=1 Tax=Anderseniella sp. Alg231-50 TaxID=1922226 RepID=UPI000D5529F7
MRQDPNPPLLGYVDRLEARAGESVNFKVSSASSLPYAARLTRSISADPNPAGQGIVEQDASEYFAPATFPSIHQPFYPGSYGVGLARVSAAAHDEISLGAVIYPTLVCDHEQTVLSVGHLSVSLSTSGLLVLRFGEREIISNLQPVLRKWSKVRVRITSNEAIVQLTSLERGDQQSSQYEGTLTADLSVSGFPVIAARLENDKAIDHFNGKIEAPWLSVDGKTVAAWDFSKEIPTTKAIASAGPDLKLVNYPARAMTSSAWDASEMNWTHKPEHYAAIHFHDDDIYDFEWDTDFTFTIPEDMPSGIYVMRLSCDGSEDAIPFFVTRPRGKPNAKLCVLVSTFTYTIYGNHARPDYAPEWQDRMDAWGAYPHNPANHRSYGLSTYNYHSDGAGICHASHHRPLFNLRPGFLTFGTTPCSGLRHFQADSHLISWLHAKGIEYDIVTDQDLHRDGVSAIQGYEAVTTGSHPEYHTAQTLNALQDYRDGGGHLLYLGANGFYWRIAVHNENDSILEIRRAEDGIRAWAAEPGEYYNAFDGGYGGLWRRNARPPQELVGIGFAAQGEFVGDPYKRVCTDPEFEWVFDGIKDDILGDFGYSGGGAAGFELDHIDYRLGTPENAVLLARSITRDDEFMLVPEEQLTHLTNLTGGTEKDALRSDIVHFDVPGGGSVFAVGSITFCGCLPWNNFDNNVSQLLENVLRNKLSG